MYHYLLVGSGSYHSFRSTFGLGIFRPGYLWVWAIFGSIFLGRVELFQFSLLVREVTFGWKMGLDLGISCRVSEYESILLALGKGKDSFKHFPFKSRQFLWNGIYLRKDGRWNLFSPSLSFSQVPLLIWTKGTVLFLQFLLFK